MVGSWWQGRAKRNPPEISPGGRVLNQPLILLPIPDRRLPKRHPMAGQTLHVRRLAQLLEGALADLADALAGDAEQLADLLEGQRLGSFLQPIVQVKDLALAGSEVAVEDAVDELAGEPARRCSPRSRNHPRRRTARLGGRRHVARSTGASSESSSRTSCVARSGSCRPNRRGPWRSLRRSARGPAPERETSRLATS